MNQTNASAEQSMPASSAEIGEALKILFNALPFQRGTDPELVVVAYAEALRGVSLDGIKAGISKFLRGECENVNHRFVPTPPELARIVRTTIVPFRVPEARRIEPFRYSSEGGRARMRLKMPMFSHAFPSQSMINELARANAAGLEAMMVLAGKWGIPIPDELNDQTEADWRRARIQALADIHRNPPPYARRASTIDEYSEGAA